MFEAPGQSPGTSAQKTRAQAALLQHAELSARSCSLRLSSAACFREMILNAGQAVPLTLPSRKEKVSILALVEKTHRSVIVLGFRKAVQLSLASAEAQRQANLFDA